MELWLGIGSQHHHIMVGVWISASPHALRLVVWCREMSLVQNVAPTNLSMAVKSYGANRYATERRSFWSPCSVVMTSDLWR